MSDSNSSFRRKPDWLKAKSILTPESEEVMAMLRKYNLHTVCEEAGCPNCGECFSRKTATFLIMGPICSRGCRFCQVTKGTPLAIDESEPEKIAEAAKLLGLKHIVITSVTRDDLSDGGASHFAAVIKSIRSKLADRIKIEVLIPDFQGSTSALKTVITAGPDILNHNIETVPSLYGKVRPEAIYTRSLNLLSAVKSIEPDMITKSGIMLGLGESQHDVIQTLQDLSEHDCDLITIGQYLAPSKEHLEVVEYIHPDQFAWYKTQALALGFKNVASGPMVRSSYMADQLSF